MDKPNLGFVSLKSVKDGFPDPAAALAEIRRIYFNTTRQTIEHDFAHAIELLKGLPDEDTRQRAHVYMEGLAEMQKQWARKVKGGKSKAGRTPKTRKSHEQK